MKAIIGVSVCVLGLFGVALGDDLHNQIDAMNGLIHKTFMNKDGAGFAAIVKGQVTPDFKYYDTPGAKPMDFEQMVAEMKKGFAAMSKVTFEETRILNAKASGSTATAMLIHTMKWQSIDSAKKTHLNIMRGVSQDTLKNVGGSWKMSSMTWKSMEMTIDSHRQKTGGM